jgi:hypothetical protein
VTYYEDATPPPLCERPGCEKDPLTWQGDDS